MTAVFDLFTFTGIFTSGLSLFLVFVLLSGKSVNKGYQLIVVALLIVLGFNVVHDTLVQAGLLVHFPHMLYTGELPNLLIWPLIYLYFTHKPTSRFSWKNSLHLLPFVVYNLSRLGEYLNSATEKKSVLRAFYQKMTKVEYLISKAWEWEAFFTDFVLWRLQGLIYIMIIGYQLTSNRRGRSAPGFSSAVFRVIFAGFAVIWLAKYALNLLPYFEQIHVFLSNKAEILLNALEILLISFWALKERSPVVHQKKANTYTLSHRQVADLSEKIKELFTRESLHLQNGLTIGEVANRLDSNANYISQVINREFQCSFTDWLNISRVNEMKKRLKDSRYDHLTIEAIARESGFNSAVTCGRAFKKVTNTSPSAFRKFK